MLTPVALVLAALVIVGLLEWINQLEAELRAMQMGMEWDDE